jgi:hypothetical protein
MVILCEFPLYQQTPQQGALLDVEPVSWMRHGKLWGILIGPKGSWRNVKILPWFWAAGELRRAPWSFYSGKPHSSVCHTAAVSCRTGFSEAAKKKCNCMSSWVDICLLFISQHSFHSYMERARTSKWRIRKGKSVDQIPLLIVLASWECSPIYSKGRIWMLNQGILNLRVLRFCFCF